MVTIIFAIFLITGIGYSLLNNRINIINETLLTSGNIAIDIVVKMIPLLCLWLGVMKIAEESGLLHKISKIMSKLIKPLFPELTSDGDAIAYLGSNLAMNILGLGSAATPFGLKAMSKMQEENKEKDTATRSMITFLVMNTASVTLIPTTVISFRILNHAKNPTDIVGICILTTVLSCAFGLIIDRILYKIWRKSK